MVFEREKKRMKKFDLVFGIQKANIFFYFIDFTINNNKETNINHKSQFKRQIFLFYH